MKAAKILIIGGGIGGLTSAIALCQRGFDVDVIERDPDWSVYGVGIIQQSNVVRAVAALGILDDYVDAGFGFDHVDVFLPDGRHFLYLARRSGAGAGVDPEIRIGALDSKEWKVVVNVASNAVCASGYLLYVREGTLVAQRFDAGRLVAEGEPVVVAPDVLMDERFSRGVFSASDDGILAYQTGKGSTSSVLRWIDRGGQILGTVGEPAEYFDGGTPEISPDGTRVAFQSTRSFIERGSGTLAQACAVQLAPLASCLV